MPNLWVTPDELGDEATSPFAYEATKTASFILWALSGRKYAGVQTATEHYECPCYSYSRRYSPLHLNEPGLFPAEPYMAAGAVLNRQRGECGCGNSTHSSLRLRHRPVRRVQEVISGGETLDPGSYQVVNGALLTAAPGASFDTCGIQVSYTYGVETPVAGKRAARYLASELAKGWSGDECALPERVTSISRQGVSYTILDDQAFLDDMRTGVYAVDLFLKAVNPDNARKPARVFSPDLPRVTRVTQSNVTPAGPYDMLVSPGSSHTWSIDLEESNSDIIDDVEWGAQLRVYTRSGSSLLTLDDDRFTMVDGVASVTLTNAETGTMTGHETFDLYAVNQVDNFTIVHLLTGSVRTSS